MIERVRINYENVEDLKDFIHSYLEECVKYDFYAKFIGCNCNTDRGVHSWYELEVDSMPNDIEFTIKNIPKETKRRVVNKIVSFINKLKFYEEVECYEDDFCENVIVKPVVYDVSEINDLVKISVGFEVF